MVSDTVSQYVDAVKFVEHEGVVVLALGSGARLVWKNSEQTAPYGTVLWICKHIYPNAKLHLGKEFGVGVTVIVLQSTVCLADNIRAVAASRNIEYAPRLYCIAEPIIAKSLNENIVNSIPDRNLKTTQQSKHFLRQIEIKAIQCHRLSGITIASCEVSLQPLLRYYSLKFSKFHFIRNLF